MIPWESYSQHLRIGDIVHDIVGLTKRHGMVLLPRYMYFINHVPILDNLTSVLPQPLPYESCLYLGIMKEIITLSLAKTPMNCPLHDMKLLMASYWPDLSLSLWIYWNEENEK
jgi:hypothetical protein